MTWQHILKNEYERHDYNRTKYLISSDNKLDLIEGINRLQNLIRDIYSKGGNSSDMKYFYLVGTFQKLQNIRMEKDFAKQKQFIENISNEIDSLIDDHKK